MHLCFGLVLFNHHSGSALATTPVLHSIFTQTLNPVDLAAIVEREAAYLVNIILASSNDELEGSQEEVASGLTDHDMVGGKP